MTLCHADTPLAISAATAKTSKQRTIDALIAASPSGVLLRDGELVLYRRTGSLLYQCRFQLADGKWHRFSIRKARLENAIAAACAMYDEARYRQRWGLAHRTHTFVQIPTNGKATDFDQWLFIEYRNSTQQIGQWFVGAPWANVVKHAWAQ